MSETLRQAAKRISKRITAPYVDREMRIAVSLAAYEAALMALTERGEVRA